MTVAQRGGTLLGVAAAFLVGLMLAACDGTSTQSAFGPTSQADSGSTSTPTTPDPPVKPQQAVMVALSAATYSVVQSAGSVTVTVIRKGPDPAQAFVRVQYSTRDGTAVAGTDYTAASGALQWDENDTSPQSITIPVSTNAFSGDKTFEVVLSNPSADTFIGDPGSATVTISGSASASVGTLQLNNSSYSVAQSAKAVTVTVNRRAGDVGATSVAYSTSNGTAVAGSDYTAAKGTLAWAAGDSSSKSFSVAVSNSKPFSGHKTFSVALSDATSGALMGDPHSASVTIAGDATAPPPVGSLELAAAAYSTTQSGGSVSIVVDRVGGSGGTASVAYATSDGTAVAGRDYSAASGTLNWADGDSASKSFSVAVSNATPFTGTRAFSVVLTKPSSGATIGNPGSASVSVSGDAAPAVGTLALSAASYGVGQGGGSLTVSVERTGGSAGAVSASYSTASGSAVAGTDFTAASGTLSWASGDTSAKTFSVPVSNATPFSGTRSFTVKLSNATGGAALGSPNSATATITGDAPAAVGALKFSTSGYSVGEAGGSVSVTVNRTGGSNGAVSVAYATADGSAVSGTNFTASSGTLQWASGDTSSKSFSVAISNATPFSGSKSFSIALSNATGGATLTSPTSATVTITGSGTAPPPPSGAFWVYYNGVFNWGGDYSYAASPNYTDTSGGPLTGPYDIAVTVTGAYGGFQPYAGGTVPLWNFVDNGYTYLTFSIKPTVANQAAQIYFMKVGDIPVGIDIDPFNGKYGPPPQQGVWTTYKIPLSELGVANTSVYKFAIQDMTGLGHNVFYLDNVGFE